MLRSNGDLAAVSFRALDSSTVLPAQPVRAARRRRRPDAVAGHHVGRAQDGRAQRSPGLSGLPRSAAGGGRRGVVRRDGAARPAGVVRAVPRGGCDERGALGRGRAGQAARDDASGDGRLRAGGTAAAPRAGGAARARPGVSGRPPAHRTVPRTRHDRRARARCARGPRRVLPGRRRRRRSRGALDPLGAGARPAASHQRSPGPHRPVGRGRRRRGGARRGRHLRAHLRRRLRRPRPRGARPHRARRRPDRRAPDPSGGALGGGAHPQLAASRVVPRLAQHRATAQRPAGRRAADPRGRARGLRRRRMGRGGREPRRPGSGRDRLGPGAARARIVARRAAADRRRARPRRHVGDGCGRPRLGIRRPARGRRRASGDGVGVGPVVGRYDERGGRADAAPAAAGSAAPGAGTTGRDRRLHAVGDRRAAASAAHHPGVQRTVVDP